MKTNISLDITKTPIVPVVRRYVPNSMKIPSITIDGISYKFEEDYLSFTSIMLSNNGRKMFTKDNVDIFLDHKDKVIDRKKVSTYYAVIVYKETNVDHDLKLTIRPKEDEVIDWVDSEIFEQILIDNYERFRDIHNFSVL